MSCSVLLATCPGNKSFSFATPPPNDYHPPPRLPPPSATLNTLGVWLFHSYFRHQCTNVKSYEVRANDCATCTVPLILCHLYCATDIFCLRCTVPPMLFSIIKICMKWLTFLLFQKLPWARNCLCGGLTNINNKRANS